MKERGLLDAIKAIVTNGRAGKYDAAYGGYAALFGGPAFGGYEAGEQRQALQLMIHAKGVPNPPTAIMVTAHRAAIGPLTTLVSLHGDPADHEMLGMCLALTGDEVRAATVFRAGLAIERERNAQSDLCGALMRRVSML